MRSLHDIPTPALVLDLDKLEHNLDLMAAKAKRLGVRLRPHIKTHKSIEIGRMQLERSGAGITVSTLEEAEAFISNGFDDVTWAFPVILNRLDEIRGLAERATFRVLVDSMEAVEALEGLGMPLQLFIKVDCGYGRAGVDPESDDAIAIAERIEASAHLDFNGILTHSGHAYHAESFADLRAAAEDERRALVDFAERLGDRGIRVRELSVGSTPAMSAVENLEGITEARPGNYALYDYMQVQLSACDVSDCAATVLASIVSSHETRSICDAGALALSKDIGVRGHRTDGEIFADYEAGTLEPDLRVLGLSQEHGKIAGRVPVGQRVRIVPNHSCLTVACFDRFFVVRGEEVVDQWSVLRSR